MKEKICQQNSRYIRGLFCQLGEDAVQLLGHLTTSPRKRVTAPALAIDV